MRSCFLSYLYYSIVVSCFASSTFCLSCVVMISHNMLRAVTRAFASSVNWSNFLRRWSMFSFCSFINLPCWRLSSNVALIWLSWRVPANLELSFLASSYFYKNRLERTCISMSPLFIEVICAAAMSCVDYIDSTTFVSASWTSAVCSLSSFVSSASLCAACSLLFAASVWAYS